MNRAIITALPLVAFLILTGCTMSLATAGTTPQPASTATGSRPPSAGPMAVPNPAPPGDDAVVIPVPEAAPTSQQTAVTAAEKVVAAFARPDLAYEDWIGGLYPLLTQTGAAAHEGTDPVNIPVRQVTGAGILLEGSTDVALIVQVPTDTGLYNVTLSRPTPEAAWLADRIRPAGA